MKYDLTTGSVSMTMLKFSLPMILGNLMQQLYNISDTLIVGHFIGTDALAAVGACLNHFFDLSIIRSLYG